MIPVSPELNSERGHGLRVGRLAVLEMKGSKRFIDARHARGVAQVIDWVWIRRHDFVEEFLVNVGRALGLARVGEVISPRTQNNLGLVEEDNSVRGIVLGVAQQIQ